MDRRFFAWFLLLTSLFFLWSSMQQRKALKLQQDQIAEQLQEEADRQAAEEAKQAMAKMLEQSDVPAPIEEPLKFYSLGSMNPNEKRPLLVTISNQGASVDRIEMVSQDKNQNYTYRSLDNRFGYPGYLAFAEVVGGLAIQNIPPGSPAEIAGNVDPTLPDGLQVGDILVQVGTQEVRTLTDYYNAMRKTEPGDDARFTIRRGAVLVNAGLQGEAARANSQPTIELKAVEPETKPAIAPEADSASEPATAISELPEDSELSEAAQSTDGSADDSAEPSAAVDPATAETPLAEVTELNEAATPIVEDTALPGTLMQFDIKLQVQPLDLLRNSNRYPTEQIDGNEQRSALLTTLASIGNRTISDGKRFITGLDEILQHNWIGKPSEDGNSVEFELPLRPFLAAAGVDADLTMVKTYRLKEYDAENPLNNFDFELTTTIRNNRDAPVKLSVRQEGLSGLNLEGWWYSVKQSTAFMSAAGARDVVLSRGNDELELITRRSIESAARDAAVANTDVPILGPGDAAEARNLKFIGVDSQYFVSAILPKDANKSSLSNLSKAAAMAIADLKPPGDVQPSKSIAMNVGFYFDSDEVEVTPAAPFERSYRIFAGPKENDLLAHYQLSNVIYYGWTIFALVAKPLSWILHLFYSIVQNYGIAIMMLTVLVRSLMFPLSWRAAAMGQRMQEMAPEIKKINETYKDDFQKRGVETQKLYKKYKLNPMASCLPLFIQLPIFIGLYRTVSTDVALRQKSLIPGLDWCSNLAGPDQFALFPAWMPEMLAGKGTGWLGPYMNLLPILTCALFIIQQKVLMPKATDEQTLMTQRIMMFMTVFMGVLFFRVPAGLCIYFITSSIWSLIERTTVKKFLPPANPNVAVEGADGTVIEAAPYKPAKPTGLKRGSEKPPESLSDVFPWLKKRFGKDGNATVAKPDTRSNDVANRTRTNKRKKKRPN